MWNIASIIVITLYDNLITRHHRDHFITHKNTKSLRYKPETNKILQLFLNMINQQQVLVNHENTGGTFVT